MDDHKIHSRIAGLLLFIPLFPAVFFGYRYLLHPTAFIYVDPILAYALVGFVGLVALTIIIGGLHGATSLFQYKPMKWWAYPYTTTLLLIFPVGTIIAVYCYWVLGSDHHNRKK